MPFGLAYCGFPAIWRPLTISKFTVWLKGIAHNWYVTDPYGYAQHIKLVYNTHQSLYEQYVTRNCEFCRADTTNRLYDAHATQPRSRLALRSTQLEEGLTPSRATSFTDASATRETHKTRNLSAYTEVCGYKNPRSGRRWPIRGQIWAGSQSGRKHRHFLHNGVGAGA